MRQGDTKAGSEYKYTPLDTDESHNDLNLADDNPDVWIIGGGPVGLVSAIHLKTQRKNLNILVSERNIKYIRTQTLRLDFNCLAHPELAEHILESVNPDKSLHGKNVFERFFCRIKRLFTGSVLKIPIQDLEKSLQEYAAKIGIKVKHEEVDHLKLLGDHPNCKFIIGADGANSTTRKTIFEKEKADLRPEELQQIVEFKYKVRNKTKGLSFRSSYYPTLKLSNFLCDEQIKDNEVTLRFFVDRATYEALGVATKKKPLHLSSTLPDKLKHDINIWLNARKYVRREEYIEGSDTITKFPLEKYKNDTFCKTENDRHWFLAGDAACGLPYFRALNVGLQCASTLCNSILVYFDDIQKQNKAASRRLIRRYTQFVDNLFGWEETSIKIKNSKVETQKWWVKASGWVPWQIKYWSNEERAYLEQPFNPKLPPPPKSNILRRNWRRIVGAVVFSFIAAAIIFTLGISSVGVGAALANFDLFLKCFSVGVSLIGALGATFLLVGLFLLGVCVGRYFEDNRRPNKEDVLNNLILFPKPKPIELVETKELKDDNRNEHKKSGSKNQRFFVSSDSDHEEGQRVIVSNENDLEDDVNNDTDSPNEGDTTRNEIQLV